MKTYRVKVNGKLYEVELESVSESQGRIETPKKSETPVATPVSEGSKEVLAPIAGKVLDIKVAVGDTVKKGQTIFIIEAMKLENEIKCPFDGTISSISVSKGANVTNKQLLAVVK